MGDHPEELLEAPLVIEYPFNRTTGPVIGTFLTALRDRRIVGIKAADGSVVCPPVEYDPTSGAPLTEMVPVGTEGEIVTWTWVSRPRDGQPLSDPHGLALIRLDGADTAMLACVAAEGPDRLRTGARVAVRWADEPEGLITDIVCFDLVEEDAS